MKDGLYCWCEDCEEKFEYDSTTKHDKHEIWKLFEWKDGKKVRENGSLIDEEKNDLES